MNPIDIVIGRLDYSIARRERRIRIQREGSVIRVAHVPSLDVGMFRTLFLIPVDQVDELVEALQQAACPQEP